MDIDLSAPALDPLVLTGRPPPPTIAEVQAELEKNKRLERKKEFLRQSALRAFGTEFCFSTNSNYSFSTDQLIQAWGEFFDAIEAIEK